MISEETEQVRHHGRQTLCRMFPDSRRRNDTGTSVLGRGWEKKKDNKRYTTTATAASAAAGDEPLRVKLPLTAAIVSKLKLGCKKVIN